MCANKTQGKGEQVKDSGFGCNPEDIQKMMKMMGQCCPGEGDTFDCSTMMEKMMACMKGTTGPGTSTETEDKNCSES